MIHDQHLTLCGVDGCRKLLNHSGNHDCYPSEPWNFFGREDKNKISKAGFATPRGGAKGAYQNHVVRSNKVIIPYERANTVNLDLFEDGYIVRLLPEQYFEGAGRPKQEFLEPNSRLIVGDNAFILYRTHESLNQFPPLPNWEVRWLRLNGQRVNSRVDGVEDVGHYVLRIPTHGQLPKRYEGPPQGIFATEYADEEINYLCKCILAWLIINTNGSPYTTAQAKHLKEILINADLFRPNDLEKKGIIRGGLTCCPLCSRHLNYNEYHDTISFDDEDGLNNAPEQIEGSTRSTIVNLFHVSPLVYDTLVHVPLNIGWGHAVCNTRLGQRACYSLSEMIEMDLKIGIIKPEGIETFGWISTDYQMIRSSNGAVWILVVNDLEPDEI